MDSVIFSNIPHADVLNCVMSQVHVWKEQFSQNWKKKLSDVKKREENQREGTTHVCFIQIKTHSVTNRVPMSNMHVSKSNNWHDRLVERERGMAFRHTHAHTHIHSWVQLCASQDLARALGCEGGDGGYEIGRNMVLCMCVCICVWQLQPSCPWRCCCNQASQGRLPAFPPLGPPPATHTHTRRLS